MISSVGAKKMCLGCSISEDEVYCYHLVGFLILTNLQNSYF